MRTIRLNEIIPDTLYQRGQFVTFPIQTKIDMLNQYNIGLVVNLWSRPDPELHAKPGLIYIHWPIAGNTRPFMAESMIELINDYLCAGVKTIVHCEAGVNRSIWLVSRLLAYQEGISGPEAYEKVSAAVSHTKMRSGLVDDLASLTWQ